MRHHTKYLSVFLGILLLPIIADIASALAFVYDPQPFHYRPWEYFEEVAYLSGDYAAEWNSNETSDLTRDHYFYYQDPHLTRVSVDADGFRTNFEPSSSYPILVAVGSAIFGSGLSDDETLPWILSEMLALPVFNGGRSPLYNTLGRPELQDVGIIIDTRVERFIKDNVFSDYDYRQTDTYQPLMQRERNIWELMGTVPPQRYLITSILTRVFERIDNDLDSYFGQEATAYRYLNHIMSTDDMNNAVNAISRRSSELDAMGFRYIFAGIPAKQTLYDESVDGFTQTYLRALTQRLNAIGVETVDLWSPFMQNRNAQLFHPYDTHWNANGTRVGAVEIAGYLRGGGTGSTAPETEETLFD